MNAKDIAKYLDKELNIENIDDDSLNGLQVENQKPIKKIGFAVDASLETFQKAIEKKCDMIIVHHGMFWAKRYEKITGPFYQKVKILIENDVALYGAHLPLDIHAKYGNNAELVRILDIKKLERIGSDYNGQGIGYLGEKNTTLEKVQAILKQNGMRTQTLPFGNKKIKKIAVNSGGGSYAYEEVAKKGADLLITGEGKHSLYHNAQEIKINIILAGHYETEIWGVKALMKPIQKKFKVKTEFIDVPVPI